VTNSWIVFCLRFEHKCGYSSRFPMYCNEEAELGPEKLSDASEGS
jgi:hypothetical protein